MKDDVIRKPTAQWWFWLLTLAVFLGLVFLGSCYREARRRRLVLRGRRKYNYHW
ncbi:MAG: hypothetical protein RQM92_03765 [Candidatus Syntrophopropionicum ammoniitolerans]